MPTYDYRCRDCGHTIEIVHSILEDGPEACERCRGPVERVLHPAGVIFRGSGFYVTDSRKPAADSSSKPASSGASSDGKGESGSAPSSSSGKDSSAPSGGGGSD